MDSIEKLSLEDEKPKKRAVGRPKKNIPRTPKPKNGIVDKPTDDIHFLEFLYDNPPVFKKLWQFFKSISVDHVQFNFTKENIYIYCMDHFKKSHIRVKINCHESNHYYRENDLEIAINSKNLELIMATINKTYNSILFLSTRGNTQKHINIEFKTDNHVEENHKIELLGEYDRFENENKFFDEDYTIKFNLHGKFFKKIISDIRSFSDYLSIKQEGFEDPLVLEYSREDKKIFSLQTFKNSKAIGLESALKDEETFRVSCKVDYIKSIASSELAENIEIFADENKPLMFAVKMDPAIEMKIITEIIDDRLI